MPDQTDHDMIRDIHTVLLGTNGQGGLVRAFEEHKQDDKTFRNDYYQFKRRIIMILSFSAGVGGLTASMVKIIGG